MKKFLVILASCALLLVGCSQSEEPRMMMVDKTPEVFIQGSLRSAADAVSIAEMALKNGGALTRSVRKVNPNAVTAVVEATTRSGNDTLFYAVDFEDNQGFALVSADRNVPPLLALIDEGSFNSDETAYNQGFQYTLEQTKEYVNQTRAIIAPQPQPDPQYSDTIFPRPKIAPNVKVKWHYERFPEGMYCSNNICGCGPLAAAQILSCYKLPESINYTFDDKDVNSEKINWDELITHNSMEDIRSLSALSNHYERCQLSLEGHKTLGRLCRELGHLGNAIYIGNGTGTLMPDMLSVLYRFIGKQPFSTGSTPEKLFDCLVNNSKSVAYVIGYQTPSGAGGHVWVADATWEVGMIIRYWGLGLITDPTVPPEMVCTEQGSISKYIHYNWGLGGSCNGYFLTDILSIKNGYEYDNLELTGDSEDCDFRYGFQYAAYSLNN